MSSKLGFHLGRVAVAGICAVLLGGAALPSSSLASTTFGADLSATPSNIDTCIEREPVYAECFCLRVYLWMSSFCHLRVTFL